MKKSWLALAMIVLAGCATQVERQPASLTPPAPGDVSSGSIQVDEDLELRPTGGYSRTIRAGSTWKQVGTVEGRRAYKPAKGVFTLEGTHVHEAYLLLDGNTLAGFYLPGESAVSWLNKKVVLKFH